MRAASLSHQYLSAKSINKNDKNLGGGGRFRGSRKHELSPGGLHGPTIAVTDPIIRRASAIDEPSSPETSVITRSISDPHSHSVIYKRDSLDPAESQATGGSISMLYN